MHISTVFKLTNFNDINIFEIKTIDGPSWTLRLALGFAVCSLGFPVYPLSFPVCPLGFPVYPLGFLVCPMCPCDFILPPGIPFCPLGFPVCPLVNLHAQREKREKEILSSFERSLKLTTEYNIGVCSFILS